MTTNTDLAYIAGIVDGEGYVGIKRSKTRYSARIQIRMVDEPAIAFISQTLGGNYYRESSHAKVGRPLFCYQASDAVAEQVIRAILPYLRVKRTQAKTVLVFRRLQSRGIRHRTKVTGHRDFPNQYGTVRRVANMAHSDEYRAWCDELWLRCRKMNGLARFQTAA